MRPNARILLTIVAAGAVAGCGGGGDGATTAKRATVPAVLVYEAAPPASTQAMDAAVAVLKRRLADLGLDGARVERSGAGRIGVTLPDRAAVARAKAVLGASGRLALYDWEAGVLGGDGRPHPDDEEITGGGSAGQPGLGTVTRAQARRRAAKAPGAIVVQAQADPGDKAAQALAEDAYYALGGSPALTGRDLVDPETDVDRETGQPTVVFDFTRAGGAKWRRVTRRLARRGAARLLPGVSPQTVAQHFAIVLDGRLISVPYVDPQENPDGIDPTNGSQISGNYTKDSARALAALLKAGPLPVTLRLAQQRTG